MGTKIDFAAGAATATAIISATAPHAAKTVVLNVSGNVLTGVGLVTAPVIIPAVATAATAISLAYGAYQLGAWYLSE